MSGDAGPWGRLIDEHRRSAARVEAARPAPPTWWSLPLGVLLPWVPYVIYELAGWQALVPVAGPYCIAVAAFGFACLFLQRLQPVVLGLLLGVGTFAIAAQPLLT